MGPPRLPPLPRVRPLPPYVPTKCLRPCPSFATLPALRVFLAVLGSTPWASLTCGAVAMLATVVFITSEFFTLPMFTDLHVDDSNMAPSAIGMSGMMQIIFFAGFEEWRTNKGKVTMETMFEDPD